MVSVNHDPVCLLFAWERGLSITLGKGKAAAICWWVRGFAPGRLTSAPACTSASFTHGVLVLRMGKGLEYHTG
jgi:hypothetical protein